MRLNEFLQYDNIVVQCHDNPDADALASGFAVYTYLKHFGKNVSLVYGGQYKIQKSNLVLMVKELEIPITYVTELEEPELLVMVDCQYQEGNVTYFPAKVIAVIDHHQICGELPPLSDVRSNLGSCATIIWNLLKKEGYEANKDRKLATALYYGLYTDTGNFTEIFHPLDKALRDEAIFDRSLITKFRNSNLSLKELEIAGQALIGYEYDEVHRFAVVAVKPCDPNILGLISDLILEVDAIDTSLVYSVLSVGVKISVRSCVKEVRAFELADAICTGVGSGGGHMEKAGGFLQLDLLKKVYKLTEVKEINTFLKERMVSYFETREKKAIRNQSSHAYIKAVVFDLDGTLLDTLQDLTNAVNAALEHMGMPFRSIEEVRTFVGNGVKKLMERAIPDGLANPQFEETYAFFREYYAAHCKENTCPYDGVIELLETLRLQGKKIAIVSNKMDPAVKILNQDYFAGLTDAAIGESEQIPKKPAPDMVQKALEELGVSQEQAVYVGDSEVDVQTAANSNIPCISVTWGFRDPKFLLEHGAEHLIDRPAELLDII